MYSTKIRVTYPAQDSRIVLYTDLDWKHGLEPVAADGVHFDFELETEHSHGIAFKPVLVKGSELIWPKRANNYRRTPGDHDIYPYFFDPEPGQIETSVPIVHQGKTRKVSIYRPPGYHENLEKKYPVLYLQDGLNVFFPELSKGPTEWNVDETVDNLAGWGLIRKLIVVAVHQEDSRMHDYTPAGWDEYAHFLLDGLKPQIDAQERTLPGNKTTAILGSSLGGLVSIHLGLKHSETFGMAGCLSGSFVEIGTDFAERIDAGEGRDVKFYIDSGMAGGDMDGFHGTRFIIESLMRQGRTFGKDILHFAFPEANHSETDWRARCCVPLQYFFGKH